MNMCCRCEELRWKDEPPLEIVYTDEAANKYCIFHAPKEHKGVDDWAFEKIVHERIRRGANGEISADGSSVSNLSGTVFPCEMYFEYANSHWLPRICFDYAEFWGSVIFGGVTFDGDIVCSNVIFHENVDFSKSKFTGKAVFTETQFHGSAIFKGIHCTGDVSFASCTFRKTVSFLSATFKSKCEFVETQFFDIATFQNSTFSSPSAFISVVFDKCVRFYGVIIDRCLLFSACVTQRGGIKMHRIKKNFT